MSTILLSVTCKLCEGLIFSEEAQYCGTPEKGYLCEKCKAKLYGAALRLGEEITACYTSFGDALINVFESEGDPLPCARCDKKGCSEMEIAFIDGEYKLLCLPCGRWYAERVLCFRNTAFAAQQKLAGYK